MPFNYTFFLLDKVKMYIKGEKRKFCTNITAILCNFYIIYLYNLRAILTWKKYHYSIKKDLDTVYRIKELDKN
jgi:hypothetical protein